MTIDSQLRYERLLSLIDQLYQTVTIGHELFEGLSALMTFDAAIFTPINWQTLELQAGYCYGSMAEKSTYSQYSHAPFDPLLFDPLCLTRLNQTVRLSDMPSSSNLEQQKCDFFIEHKPYRHAMGVVASWRQQPVAAIRLYRQDSAEDFSNADVALLNRLARHVANAVYLQDTSIALEPLRETGLIVYGANDSLLYQNESVKIMLEGIPLESVLHTVRKGGIWLKNGTELYRAEIVPLTPTSLLTLLAKSEAQEILGNIDDSGPSDNEAQSITIISIEPFRRRHAVANRLKRSGLSQREIDVALGIMRGLSNSNIAKLLFIDEKTVKDHLQRIYAKVNIKTRTELISKMLGLDTELAEHELPTSPDLDGS